MNDTEPQAKGKVLLVDDDKFLLDMYAMKFSQSGFGVQACLSAADALSALRGGYSPDAILFDILMPEGDGFFFLESMRKENLGTHACKIALTNEMNEDEQKRAAELGAARYIVKATMIPSEVVNAVAEEIAKQKT